MSFQTFVTERLAAITAQLNAIATNAKKIIELPVQSTLDPASKIHVSRGGISESLEVQKIIDAITEKNYSQLLSIGEITVSELDVIIPSGAMWAYEGIIYQTTSITTLPETLCAAGFLRKDILVANQLNQIVLVKGTESETIRIKPNIPIGTVLVTEIDVDDTVIGTPSQPIIGDIYLKKEYYATRIASGETGVVDMPQERTRLYLFNCDFLDYLVWGDNPFVYHGMDFFVSNNNIDHRQLTIKHLSGSETGRFSFPDGQDMILQYGELLHFKMQMPSRTMEYVGTDYKKADKAYVDVADSELQIQVDELKAKTDSDNNFKVIPDPGYTFNTTTRVLTMNAGWIGTINGVDYTNLAPQPFTAIPLAPSGYSRIDLIVFKTDTTFVRIAGTPSTFTPVAPPKPTNTLQATFLTVGDGEIIVPVTPKPKAPVTSVNGMVGAVTIAKATDTLSGTVRTDTTEPDPVVYTKATTDNLLKAKVNAILEIKPITGIAYSLTAYDTENLVQLAYDGTLPMTVTIPNDATLNLPVGSIFYTVASNTGALTIAGGVGVTFQTAVGMTAGQNETRKYVKKAANIWGVEGGVAATVSIPLSKIAYVDGTDGNDSTAMIGNIGKPYLTIDAAITAISTGVNYTEYKIIEIIKQGTYYVNNTIPDSYNFYFKTNNVITLSWLNNTNSRVPQGIWSGKWVFDMPYSIIDFQSNVAKSWSNNTLEMHIVADVVKVNANSTGNRIKKMICNEIISASSSGFVVLNDSIVVLKKITTTGNGTLIVYMEAGSILDFDTFSGTGNYCICNGVQGNVIINHGNFTTSSTNIIQYINPNNSSGLLTINYKNKANIVGNVRIGDHNTAQRVRLTGTCVYNSTSIAVLSRMISGNNCLLITENFNYKGLYFIGGFAYTNSPNQPIVEIINSYFEIDSAFYSLAWSSGVYANPLITFKGHNTIYCLISTANYINVSGGSTGNVINVIGTLKTNGVLGSSVSQNNLI